MGRAKRARSVVLSASVAALGAAGSCPAANAASEAAPAARPVRAVVARAHANPRRRPRPPAPAPHGPYVYTVHVGGEINVEKANTQCAGGSIKIGPGQSRDAGNLGRDRALLSQRIVLG